MTESTTLRSLQHGGLRPVVRATDKRIRTGESHHSWKGGRRWDGRYWMVKMPSHPRANSYTGYVYEHILVVERALGKYLRLGADVHHVDGDGGNNANVNLVACNNAAYHKLLHMRARAVLACGNPDWRRCVFCRQYDSLANLKQQGQTATMYHAACRRRYDMERRTPR